MGKSKRISNSKFKEIISVCQDAIKGKTKLEDADLLSFLPELRIEIKKGKFNHSSIKAITMSSRVLDLKTRKLLGEFLQIESGLENVPPEKLYDAYSIESTLIHPINSFTDYIVESEIIKAYNELLKIRKHKIEYSVGEKEEICVERKDVFEEIDSFEQDKSKLYLKLIKSNQKNINFDTLQTNWEDAVINLIYLAHLAQEGKVFLEQAPNGKIKISLKN